LAEYRGCEIRPEYEGCQYHRWKAETYLSAQIVVATIHLVVGFWFNAKLALQIVGDGLQT
jgi:hypothetical protein